MVIVLDHWSPSCYDHTTALLGGNGLDPQFHYIHGQRDLRYLLACLAVAFIAVTTKKSSICLFQNVQDLTK